MTAGPDRPATGDEVVDGALAALDEQLGRGDDPVGAVSAAHRALQERLTTPAEPGEAGRARPGPAG